MDSPKGTPKDILNQSRILSKFSHMQDIVRKFCHGTQDKNAFQQIDAALSQCLKKIEIIYNRKQQILKKKQTTIQMIQNNAGKELVHNPQKRKKEHLLKFKQMITNYRFNAFVSQQKSKQQRRLQQFCPLLQIIERAFQQISAVFFVSLDEQIQEQEKKLDIQKKEYIETEEQINQYSQKGVQFIKSELSLIVAEQDDRNCNKNMLQNSQQIQTQQQIDKLLHFDQKIKSKGQKPSLKEDMERKLENQKSEDKFQAQSIINELRLKKKSQDHQSEQVENNQIDEQKYSQKIQQQNPQDLCQQHQLQILYSCGSKHYDGSYSLCNQCLIACRKTQKHKNHIFYCKKHKSQQIKYKMKDEDSFHCIKCLKEYSNKIFTRISNSYHSEVLYICIEQSCIKDDNFMICQEDQIMHHQHKKIKFEVQQFRQKFNVQAQIFQHFGSIFQNVKSKLLFNDPINKIYIFTGKCLCLVQWLHFKYSIKLQYFYIFIIEYLQKSKQMIQFLQSFGVESNNQVMKHIKIFFATVEKEHLLILLGVNHLKELKYQQKQKEDYLKLLNNWLEDSIKLILNQINQILSFHAYNNKKLVQKSHDRQCWNQQYQVIINKQSFQFPYKLSEISKQHKHLTKAVYLTNVNQFQNQNHQIDHRNQRRKIYRSSQLSKFKDQNQKDKFIYCNYQNQYKPSDKNICVSLLLDIQKLQQQFQQKQKIYQPIITLQSGFSNLRVIEIKQKRNFWWQFDSEIEASSLFRIIHFNKNIQKIIIEGVGVNDLDLFVKHLRIIQHQQYDTSLLKQNILIHQEKQQSQIIYVNLQRKKDIAWMKAFCHQKLLSMSIEAELNFNLSCEQIVKEKIQNLKYLNRQNIIFSNINFRINLHRNDRVQELKYLLKIMKKMKRIRLTIVRYQLIELSQNDPFRCLLQQLQQFTNISSLELKDISIVLKDSQVEQEVLIKTYDQLKTYFKTIDEKNEINHLKIRNCSMNELPYFHNLHAIQISNSKFNKGFKQCIEQNIDLKIIKISMLSKEGDLLNQDDLKSKISLANHHSLEVLEIYDFLINLNLNQIDFKNLKYLKIIFKDQVIISKLNNIFQQLVNIIDLTLFFNNKEQYIIEQEASKNNKHSQDLKEKHEQNIRPQNKEILFANIPSIQLKSLHIYQWNEVTSKDIKAILKRESLNQLRIHSCPQVKQDIFQSITLFKNLFTFKIDRKIFENSLDKLRLLKQRGIKVMFYQR